MKLTEFIAKCTPDKARIIDEITEFHPGYGVTQGYSDFSGGMGEKGGWIWESMVEADESELLCFLQKLQEAKDNDSFSASGDEVVTRKDFKVISTRGRNGFF